MNFRMDRRTLERTVVSLHRIGPMRGQAPPTLDGMIRDSLFLRIPGGCSTQRHKYVPDTEPILSTRRCDRHPTAQARVPRHKPTGSLHFTAG